MGRRETEQFLLGCMYLNYCWNVSIRINFSCAPGQMYFLTYVLAMNYSITTLLHLTQLHQILHESMPLGLAVHAPDSSRIFALLPMH